MILQVIGCSHHVSNVKVRERLAFSENQVKPFLDTYYRSFPDSEAVLLSTCNRTEFYAAAASEDQLPSEDAMVRFLAEQCGVRSDEINTDLFAYRDRTAIQHLFTVAASLDSMVIGEAQILSQVKRAYQLASETNSEIPITHQVFQSAIRVARRISNETEIHANRVSVPSVAIGVLAKQIFERLDNKHILIIGAGEMAEETLNYIRYEGGRDIAIVNRTLSKAEELAIRWEGKVLPWESLEKQLAVADLIVSTTGAKEPVVTADMFDRIESQRNQRPLFILDLAVPRDFDGKIDDRSNVYLYTLDDLQRECEHNRRSRESQYPKAVAIIESETDLFFDEMRRRSSGSTIAQLKRQVNDVKEAEFIRLMNRLDGIDPKHQSEIEQSFNRLVNKILHPPVKSVQSDSKSGTNGLLDALKKLFQLGD